MKKGKWSVNQALTQHQPRKGRQKTGKGKDDNFHFFDGNAGKPCGFTVAANGIMCIIISITTDKFLTAANVVSVLRQISINTYIALGMTLIIILGHIDLSVGAIVAMSGTLTVGFIVNQGMPGPDCSVPRISFCFHSSLINPSCSIFHNFFLR